MPNNLTTNLADMLISLRFAYEQENNRKIDEIKQNFQKTLNEMAITEKQKILFKEEFNLIIWEKEKNYSSNDLLGAKERLEQSNFYSPSPSSISSLSPSSVASWNSLRWEKMVESRNSVVDSLSQLTSSQASKDEAKRINLIKKIDALMEKMEAENFKINQDVFEQVKASFNDKAFLDMRAFLRALILFYQENLTRDDYAKELRKKIILLSDEELKLLYKRMYSEEMVSFINVAFTQAEVIRFAGKDFEDRACQDAISIWPANQNRMKLMLLELEQKKQLIIKDLQGEAEAYFLGGAEQINVMLRFLCSDVKNEMISRRNNDANFCDETEFQADRPDPFFSHWPCDENGKRECIKISPLQKQLVAEAAFGLITQGNPLAKPERETGIDKSLLLERHFTDMMRALGGFFNPNLFCDALYSLNTLKPEYIKQSVDALEEKDLYALHENFQRDDLNKLMAMLQRIKEGSKDQLKGIGDWLLIKNPGLVNAELRVAAEKIYDSAHLFMQTVRQKVQKIETQRESTTYVTLAQVSNNIIIKDYAYNDLELKESKIYTYKNSACMKHILERFCAASPGIEFKRTLFDRFYDFFYPGQRMPQTAERECLELLRGSFVHAYDEEDLIEPFIQ